MVLIITVGFVVIVYLVCKTILLISTNNKNYDELKKKLDYRKSIIGSISFLVDNSKALLNVINKEKLPSYDKDNLGLIDRNLDDIANMLKNYEKDKYD